MLLKCPVLRSPEVLFFIISHGILGYTHPMNLVLNITDSYFFRSSCPHLFSFPSIQICISPSPGFSLLSRISAPPPPHQHDSTPSYIFGNLHPLFCSPNYYDLAKLLRFCAHFLRAKLLRLLGQEKFASGCF